MATNLGCNRQPTPLPPILGSGLRLLWLTLMLFLSGFLFFVFFFSSFFLSFFFLQLKLIIASIDFCIASRQAEAANNNPKNYCKDMIGNEMAVVIWNKCCNINKSSFVCFIKLQRHSFGEEVKRNGFGTQKMAPRAFELAINVNVVQQHNYKSWLSTFQQCSCAKLQQHE